MSFIHEFLDFNLFEKFFEIDWYNRDLDDVVNANANDDESSDDTLNFEISFSRPLRINDDRSEIETDWTNDDDDDQYADCEWFMK